MRRQLCLMVLGVLGCAGSPTHVPPPGGRDIDWEAEARACAELLKQMIRIDTTNPPPPGSSKKNAGETVLCRFVQKLLAAEGIAAQVLESEPGRGNLVARYKGEGSRRPILLMAHVDVVNVDRSRWIVDPYGGVERDGYIWGRGAIDDKGMAAVITHVFRLLHRHRPKLSRDVILMLNADEESSARFGARWMVENHPDLIDAEYVLNEGGRISLDPDGKVAQVAVQAAEKIYNDVWIWVRGESGHSSVPRADNAIYTLSEILARLRAFKFPIHIHEIMKAWLQGARDLPSFAPQRPLFERALAGDLEAAETLASQNPRLNALLRTTFVPTIVKGGLRANVLPPEAMVNLNIRLLPGDNLDRAIRELAQAAGLSDYAVVPMEKFEEWKREQEEQRRAGKKACPAAFVIDSRDQEAPASPIDTPMMEAIRKVCATMFPNVPVLPFMSTGATDSRWFRARGVACYGLMPLPLTEEEEKGFHDHNERVRTASVRTGLEFTYRLVLEAGR